MHAGRVLETTTHLSDGDSKKIMKIKLFDAIDVEANRIVGNTTVWTKYDPGNYIVMQGDSSTHVYFIAEGRVRANFLSSDGKEVSFSDFGPGDIIGEFAAIDHAPRASNVVALTHVEAGRMDAANFQKLIRDHPGIAWRLMELLVAKARALSERVAEFSVLAARHRLQHEIIRMAGKGKPQSGRIVISDFPTHQELANRISSHREAVTRELGLLAADNIIVIKRGAIEILDIERLQQIARHFDTGRGGDQQ
ncbi:Crp/Fnr family transcriptional regulator [Oleomonas cavernae]|uniref:Crp/Fnr family transcriptional regulator n=1 Tax=Oleomonas cavernae TaxID=2320859 RepID=A0A418W8W3_9PROT|nr:Crp/Fnr family transcriptional regulator [Oleomonas cavernae]RJF86471.1 Crp/Fnr family transcriptional regulator [Oleomonas cavernae]